MEEELAVQVQGATKHFGRGSRRVLVLDHLDMNVPKGSIYALLGASGCGKTTLLSCIVGQLKLNSGDICALGGKPGTKESGVPGPRVGYMPQELALMNLFSVKESIFYFGWLFGMSNRCLQERYDYLSSLLQLPKGSQLIKDLSGGQQRRVSIAAALVHGAELLILDEPTVGLDPVLRDIIWQHMMFMAKELNTTIIITTHYIEEARQAHRIGLIRQGKLLAEDKPERLLIRYNCPSLEEVFLKLSVQQSSGNMLKEPSEVEEDVHIEAANVENAPLQVPCNSSYNDKMNQWSECNSKEHHPSFLFRMKPLLIKNAYGLLRSSGELLNLFVMPVLIVFLVYYAFGRYPDNLKLGIVNEELGNYSTCEEFMSDGHAGITTLDADKCRYSGISCLFVSQVNDSIATKVYYPDKQSGLNAVNKGNVYGLLYFAANYSSELQTRLELGRYSSDSTVESSELQVFMEPHDPQVSGMVKVKLYQLFREVAYNLTTACNEKFVDIPIQFHNPVYGEKYPELFSYFVPRTVIFIAFYGGTLVTSAAIVNDRLSGIWNRNTVAGVTLAEILLSHLFLQMAIALFYCAEILGIMFFVFKVKYIGNIFTVFMLVYLHAICGSTLGLWISIISTSYIMATMLTLGTFIPVFCFTGAVWPIEGMYFLLKYPALAMPVTISTMSMTNILYRGWSILDPGVFSGFLILIGWIGAFTLFSLFTLRVKS